MFAIIAVPFDAFQALPRPEHRWLLTCFSRYVDRAGDGVPVVTSARRRRPHVIGKRQSPYGRAGASWRCFTASASPAAATSTSRRKPTDHAGRVVLHWVFQQQKGCFTGRNTRSRAPKQARGAHPRGDSPIARSASARCRSDERAKWDARLRSWRQSRFWLPLWGPKPTEAGCFAPVEALPQGT